MVNPTEVTELLNQAEALALSPVFGTGIAAGCTGKRSARGLPLIVSDQCAAREFVQPEQAGFLYRGGDIEDLKAKLTMLQDDLLAQKLGQNAYDHFGAGVSRLKIILIGSKKFMRRFLVGRIQHHGQGERPQ